MADDLRYDLWHCKDCHAAYAIGLEKCPNCGSTKHTEPGEALYGEGAEVTKPKRPKGK